MANLWIPVIICSIVVILYSTLFIFLYSRLKSQYGKGWEFTIMLSLFTLSTASGYFFWILRLILFSPESAVGQWIWLWKLSTLLLILGAFFLGFFILVSTEGINRNITFILLFIPLMLVLGILFIVIQADTITKINYYGISNVNLENNSLFLSPLVFILSLAPLFYLSKYYQINPLKFSQNIKKVKFLMIGIFLHAIGLSLEISKFEFIVNLFNGLGSQLSRVFIILAGTAIFYGFLKYNSSNNKNEDSLVFY